MKIITQVEIMHYECDECKRRILDEKSVITIKYETRSGNGFDMHKRTKHYCSTCARKKGIL